MFTSLSFPLSPPLFVSYIVSARFHSFLHVSFCSLIMTPILALVLKTNGFNSPSVLSPFAIVSPFQVHLQEGTSIPRVFIYLKTGVDFYRAQLGKDWDHRTTLSYR